MRTGEIQKSTSALAVQGRPVMAVDVRRNLIAIPEVMANLQKVEKYIMVASTKRTIGEIPDEELIPVMREALNGIARDVGYVKPTDPVEWQAMSARIYTFLKDFYEWSTVSEIKLAFELAASGDLDQYLPKGRDGDVTSGHFNKFNIEYFARILNAYKRRRGETIGKAQKLLPIAQERRSAEEIQAINKSLRIRAADHYNRYLQEGIINFEICEDMFIYDILRERELCPALYTTEDDKAKAMAEYASFAVNGLVNNFMLTQVKKAGNDAPELLGLSYTAARKRIIRDAYEVMKNQKINFVELLNIENHEFEADEKGVSVA